MPYYFVNQTQFDLLANAVKSGQIMGVGMLSQFVRIDIEQSWRVEDVIGQV